MNIASILFGAWQTLKSGESVRTSKGLLTSKTTAGAILAALGWLSQTFGWQFSPDAVQPIIEGLLMAGGGLTSVLGLRSASLPFAWQVPAVAVAQVKGKRGGSRGPRKPKAPADPNAPAPAKRARRTKAEMEAAKAQESSVPVAAKPPIPPPTVIRPATAPAQSSAV